MTPSERDHARRRAYGLFAALYRDGLTPENVEAVRGLPGLSAHVPDPFDPDLAAAEHYDVFGLNVFPYASAFLDPEGRLGGETAEEASAWRMRFGRVPDAGSEGPDHIAAELDLLAEYPPESGPGLCFAFLGEHVVVWLLPFASALQRGPSPLYAALGRLTLDLVADQLASSGGTARSPSFPVEENLLGRSETGIRDIARFLATPVRSGLWLSREELRVLGRGRRLPAGFGGRVDLLTNLLRSSAEYDSQISLIEDLMALVAEHEAFYEEASRAYPVVSHAGAGWLERLGGTRRVLKGMAESGEYGG